MALPIAYVSHRMNGRLRVRIPGRKNDAGYFKRVSEGFAKCGGIREVEANPRTGSLLLTHTVALAQITDYAVEHGFFQLAPENVNGGPLSARLAADLGAVSDRFTALSKGQIDTRAAAFAGLAAAGLFQMLKRNVWPAGITLLWYAVSVLPSTRSQKQPGE